MEWIEFLDSIAVQHKLTAAQRDTLLARLDRKNDKQTNLWIALNLLYISEAEIKKRLGEIYKIFEPTCPDIATSQSRGKVEALRACLWKQYEHRNSQPPQPEPVGTPSNLPLSGVVKFVGREEALKTVHEQLQEATTVAISSVWGMQRGLSRSWRMRRGCANGWGIGRWGWSWWGGIWRGNRM